MTAVTRSWPEATVVIIAGGPTLSRRDVDVVLEARKASPALKIIAIKDAIRLCPTADLLYGCDAKWWAYYGPTLTFSGPRYALEAKAAPWATVLRWTGETGLELDPTALRTGRNSGYQAINIAVHLGARRIVLLGYDMHHGGKAGHHWFGKHPYATADPPYDHFRRMFPTIVEPLAALGVEVVNATPSSSLTCFPRVSLVEALEGVAA